MTSPRATRPFPTHSSASDGGTETRIIHAASPRMLVECVPHLVGFEPHASLVIVGFEAVADGPRMRSHCCLRLDLPLARGDFPPATDAAWAGHFDHFIERAAPVAVALFAWCTADRSDESGRERHSATDADLLTGAPDVLRSVERHFRAAGVEVKDLVVVEGDSFRSVDCREPTCCPPEGHPRTTPADALANEPALAGLPQPLASRAVLETRVALDDSLREAAVQSPISQAQEDAWFGPQVGHEDGPVIALLDAVEAGATPTASELSLLSGAMWWGSVRDHAVRRTLTTRRVGSLRRLWELMCRGCDADRVLAPAALAALAAALDGDGAAANVAIERGLVAHPGDDHVHALLFNSVSAVIGAHLRPDEIRALLGQVYVPPSAGGLAE